MISDMFELRQRVRNNSAPLRVNDEAILAAVAHKSGAAILNLYDFEEVFNPRCLATNPPHLLDSVNANPGDPSALPVQPVTTG